MVENRRQLGTEIENFPAESLNLYYFFGWKIVQWCSGCFKINKSKISFA